MEQRLIIQLGQLQDDGLHLTASQQHYLSRVLRLTAGDTFLALDGQGGQWRVRVTAKPAVAEVMVSLESAAIASPPLTLVAALPKGNSFDDVVRQVTELGVAAIQPVITQRTLLQPSPKRLERWQRIAMEATEQSERLTVPDIRPPLGWSEWLGQVPPGAYLCTARGTAPHLLHQLRSPAAAATVIVGPEGGWTSDEIAAAQVQGCQPVSLGRPVLRAVTAAIAAVTLAQAALELQGSWP